ncbi:MAG: class I SAM-dependent rRNA methyltransferase [Xanthomonadales bacterium]|jgi:23S rRNA (cytosine1962-C5)-methyltransferase|nr:class I SAM-dependent rRNA methyltransferase [Xanthomonadales bacterium]
MSSRERQRPEREVPADALVIRVSAARKLHAGHLWIYGNELARPAKAPPGAVVDVYSEVDEPLGVAYINPASLLYGRLLSHQVGTPIDTGWFAERLREARRLRERLGSARFGRQVYGEADGLPGLILDAHGEVLVGQITTLGMEMRLAEIEEAIRAVYAPQALYWRNTVSSRKLEGLESYSKVAFGELPEAAEIIENGIRYQVPVATGQKTGWFYDQRDNRARVAPLLAGRKRVLDVCAYLGGWGLTAAMAGAERVRFVDSSPLAARYIGINAELNGVSERCDVVQAEAFEALKAMVRDGEQYDAVILDPPAFIKRRKDLKEGGLAYQRLFELGVRLLEPGGLLVACSCSYHYDYGTLVDAVMRVADRGRRRVRLLQTLTQSADHPVVPAMPETAYLKGIAAQIDARW